MKKPNWMTVITVVAAFAFVSTSAAAQTQQCDQRQKVIGHLAKKYQETPIAAGVTSAGGLVERVPSPDSDNPHRKYYGLTSKGTGELSSAVQELNRVAATAESRVGRLVPKEA